MNSVGCAVKCETSGFRGVEVEGKGAPYSQ